MKQSVSAIKSLLIERSYSPADRCHRVISELLKFYARHHVVVDTNKVTVSKFISDLMVMISIRSENVEHFKDKTSPIYLYVKLKCVHGVFTSF